MMARYKICISDGHVRVFLRDTHEVYRDMATHEGVVGARAWVYKHAEQHSIPHIFIEHDDESADLLGP